MNNVNDAYDHVMSVVNSIENSGIVVSRRPPATISKSNDPENLSVVKDYEGSLHWTKWVKITFKPKNEDEWDRLSFAVEYFRDNGVGFDTGGGSGFFDWEIDWSLRFNPESTMTYSEKTFNELLGEFIKKN